MWTDNVLHFQCGSALYRLWFWNLKLQASDISQLLIAKKITPFFWRPLWIFHFVLFFGIFLLRLGCVFSGAGGGGTDPLSPESSEPHLASIWPPAETHLASIHSSQGRSASARSFASRRVSACLVNMMFSKQQPIKYHCRIFCSAGKILWFDRWVFRTEKPVNDMSFRNLIWGRLSFEAWMLALCV